MFQKSIVSAVLISLFFMSGCGGSKKSPAQVAAQTPNIKTFPLPIQKVWRTTLDTIEYDFLMGLEHQEPQKGFFTTEMIRDYQPFQKRRFRVSGSLIWDGQGTIVKLYKHEEIEVNGEWQAIPSNSTLESQILQKISKRLQQKPK
jgi:hypothetical protein